MLCLYINMPESEIVLCFELRADDLMKSVCVHLYPSMVMHELNWLIDCIMVNWVSEASNQPNEPTNTKKMGVECRLAS